MATTTDDGATWNERKPPKNVLFDAVACPSVTTCEIVGGDAARTTNGGLTWKLQAVPSRVSVLGGVACASVSTCEAVGDSKTLGAATVVTTNGGTNWKFQKPPTGKAYLGGVACLSSGSCQAVGGGTSSSLGVILRSAQIGAPWSLGPSTAGGFTPGPVVNACDLLTPSLAAQVFGAAQPAGGTPSATKQTETTECVWDPSVSNGEALEVDYFAGSNTNPSYEAQSAVAQECGSSAPTSVPGVGDSAYYCGGDMAAAKDFVVVEFQSSAISPPPSVASESAAMKIALAKATAS
jgi:hypothetical protein